jgi:S-adenosylmethionine decarboxylase
MRLSVIVATLEGCPAALLDDARSVERLLTDAVAAGGLHELHRHVHQFSPQGLTAMVMLSESHIALHTWPEHGLLFVDLATCSGAAATQAAFDAICAALPHTGVIRKRWELAPAIEAAPGAPAARPS